MNLGFGVTRVLDNKKSWADSETGFRNNFKGGLNSYYQVNDDRLVINSKNIEVFLNMGQGLVYDVWDMSRKVNYPIPDSGLTSNQQDTTGIDRTIIDPKPKSKTFFEFAQTFYKNMINVRNRQKSTYNYPSLQKIYWNYINSDETVNLPSNKYTYQKMIDFTDGLGDHWIKLLEQMVPASTLWSAGQKFENSVFDRQKVVWRKQRGCEIIPVPCIPCRLTGPIFTYDCVTKSITCDLSLEDPSLLLNQVLQNTLTQNGYDQNQCDLNSLVSNWYGVIKLGDTLISQYSFFVGNGINQIPSENLWVNTTKQQLSGVTTYGLNFTESGNTVQVFNAGCDTLFTEDSFSINIKIDLTLNCQSNTSGLLTYIDNQPLWSNLNSAIEYGIENDIEGYYTINYQGQTAYIAGQENQNSRTISKVVTNPFIKSVSYSINNN